jgi:Family of unknown function (DUF6270)
VTVAIFGSCVSRDLFEDPALRPSLGLYAARSSVASAVAAPVGIDPDRVVLSSAWQRRCVLADFHKTFFASLARARPQWLVIDLVDERFDLLRGAGSIVTRSSAFQAAGLDEADDFAFERVRRMSGEGHALFERAAGAFAERVMELVAPERIVLHRALWCRSYRVDGETVAFPEARLALGEQQNAMLNHGYDALAEAFGGRAATIEVDPSAHRADAAHRWELEPYHYEPAYNEQAAERLGALFGLR